MEIKKPFIKPIKIRLKGLEEVLERTEELSDVSENFANKKFNRYKGSFLILGKSLIRIPEFNFLNYEEMEFDVNDYGVFPSVVYNNFEQGKLHGHFKDGSILDFQRKNYIGKVGTR